MSRLRNYLEITTGDGKNNFFNKDCSQKIAPPIRGLLCKFHNFFRNQSKSTRQPLKPATLNEGACNEGLPTPD